MNNWSNLKYRLLTASGLGIALLAAMFLAPSWLWTAFVTLFVAGGLWEWAGLAAYSKPARLIYTLTGTLIGLILIGYGFHNSWPVYALAGLFWLIVVPVWLKRGWTLANKTIAAGTGLLVMLPCFLAMLYLQAEGAWILLAAMGIAIIADTAAYFSGRAFGKHKLAPRISPGKTREGALGAWLAVSLFAILIILFSGTECSVPCAVLAMAAFWALFVLSVLGDLFESWIKRRAGVKDSGTLLPGHGGVLDRVDSLTAILPSAALLWMWFQ